MNAAHPRLRGVVLVGICVAALATRVVADQRLVDLDRSTVTVHVFKAGLFRALADDHVIQAALSDGSLDNDAATPHVQIVIDARQMRVLDPGLSAGDRQKVQTRMLGPEVLDVTRFPWISFHSLESRRLNASGWEVKGELELHGHIRPMAVTVVEESGRYKGSATLRQSDFGIVPISIVGGTVKVKNEIRIDFDIVMR